MLNRLLVTCWLFLFALCAHAAPLWDEAAELETLLDALSPGAVSAWAVAPHVEQVYLRPQSLEIRLPGRAPIAAQRVHVFERADRDLTWIGRLSDSEDQIMLTAREGWISGLIYYGDSVYELRPDADHGHVLLKLDQSQFPPCAGGVEPSQDFRRPETRPQSRGESDRLPRPSSFFSGFDETSRDTPVVIDVLVVYSAAARQNLGGTAQIQAHAQAAVDNGNLSFLNSQVEVVWNVVHMEEIPFTESGSCAERLNQLRTSAQANALRDEFEADMVGMLLADAGGACGCGYVMRNNSLGPGFAPWAFQVTQNSCAVGNLTYAHEHGHNMGMEHDPVWGAPPSQASYPWSFGHFLSGSFRTVMSYANECVGGCPRQAHFSNPDVNFQGSPTGIENQRDNARTARLTAPIIADFRGPQPVEELGNGVPVTDLVGAQGSERFFSIELPSGATDLEISISGGSGDADLYVRFGSLPTLELFDCRPYLVGNNESCTFAAPDEGTYFVMLHGFEAYAGVTLLASFTPPQSTFDLNVQSSGATNVPITSPTAGLGGTTNYTRTVAEGVELELTAPATFGAANFSAWSDCDSVGGDGDRTCTLTMNQNRTVTANFVAQTRIIRLTGNLNFGGVAVGSTETRSFRIHNDGSDPLEVSGISFPADVFTANWSGGTVAPGGSRLVTVTFAPLEPQSYTGEVVVDSNATSGTNTRAISGSGLGEMIFDDRFEAGDSAQDCPECREH